MLVPLMGEHISFSTTPLLKGTSLSIAYIKRTLDSALLHNRIQMRYRKLMSSELCRHEGQNTGFLAML